MKSNEHVLMCDLHAYACGKSMPPASYFHRLYPLAELLSINCRGVQLNARYDKGAFFQILLIRMDAPTAFYKHLFVIPAKSGISRDDRFIRLCRGLINQTPTISRLENGAQNNANITHKPRQTADFERILLTGSEN